MDPVTASAAAILAVILATLVRGASRSRKRRATSRRPAPRPRPSVKPRARAPRATKPSSAATRHGGGGPGARRRYPGDFTGTLRPVYAPKPDGRPDPGEIVWTWVPYEDDPAQGKDRPVLLVGRDRSWLLALMMTSKDHDVDAADEARWGRHWMDIGTGAWDARGRPSEVRLDRVIRVHPDDVRREGAVLDERVFERVARGVEGLASGRQD